MKHLYILIVAILAGSCQHTDGGKDDGVWTELWNGQDFSGWHTYLGTPYQMTEDSLGNEIQPFGVDSDPLGVITVVPTDQRNAIRISGVAWGMLYSEATFRNYHLKLMAKWGNDKHPPRKDQPRDSGLLYHGFGPPGSANNWMSSQELQIQQGDLGDYWPVGDVEIDIPSVLHDSLYYIYEKDADLRTYYLAEILNTAAHDSMAKRRVLKAIDAEKPHGEWNQVELITYGDSSIHIVNGQVVMRLYNSRTMSSKHPLIKGKIILQSEGAEVFYKDLFLKEIEAIPDKWKE